jgi:hypothetical protein
METLEFFRTPPRVDHGTFRDDLDALADQGKSRRV